MKAPIFSRPLQTSQPIRMQGQQKYCHLLEKKGTHPMRMQHFRTKQIPHATEAIRMQGFQTHTVAQPMSIQDFQTQQKLCVTEVQHNAEKHSLLKCTMFKSVVRLLVFNQ